jgi:hypothetical protein
MGKDITLITPISAAVYALSNPFLHPISSHEMLPAHCCIPKYTRKTTKNNFPGNF